jgi:hypothetical protein
VRGKGGVEVLRGPDGARYPSGTGFSLDVLRPGHRAGSASSSTPLAASSSQGVDAIGRAAARIGAGDLPGGLRLAAEAAPPGTAALLLQAASAAQQAHTADDEIAPLLEILIEIRAGLRERGEWALADGLRDRLLAIGFELRDTPEGTVWARRSA